MTGIIDTEAPAHLFMQIKRGDTESFDVTIQDTAGAAVDITGRTYLCQLRRSTESATVAAAFICTVPTGTDGVIVGSMSAATTADLALGSYVADLQETASGVVTTLIHWDVEVTGDVSR